MREEEGVGERREDERGRGLEGREKEVEVDGEVLLRGSSSPAAAAGS